MAGVSTWATKSALIHKGTRSILQPHERDKENTQGWSNDFNKSRHATNTHQAFTDAGNHSGASLGWYRKQRSRLFKRRLVRRGSMQCLPSPACRIEWYGWPVVESRGLNRHLHCLLQSDHGCHGRATGARRGFQAVPIVSRRYHCH